jgi:hypothetical protein
MHAIICSHRKLIIDDSVILGFNCYYSMAASSNGNHSQISQCIRDKANRIRLSIERFVINRSFLNIFVLFKLSVFNSH